MAKPKRSLLPDSVRAGLEGSDATESGARGTRRAKSQNLVESSIVQRRVDFAGSKNRFDLRPEIEVAISLRIEEWADAESISSDEYGFAVSIVNGERKLAIQPLQQICAPLLVTVNQNLGMTSRTKCVPARLELVANLGVVVNLAR